MKKCQNCGFENPDEMNFCGECGATLSDAPRMVVPLETIQNQAISEKITEPFPAKEETETIVGNRYYPPSVPTFSTQTPRSNKLAFIVFGGLFAVFFLIFAAGATLLYFYYQKQKEIIEIKRTPTATRPPKTATPTLKASATPKITPSPTPEATFTPPTEPTRKDSVTIDADEANWKLSKIDTVPSETFQTSVRGTINLDEIGKNVSAKGVSRNPERRIYKQFPTGALLMRTRYADGKTSNIQPVAATNTWQNYPNERGRLEFLINDKAPESNEGAFTVTVELVSVP